MKNNTQTNNRRDFMKILGLGALVSASSAFASGGRRASSSVTAELSEEQKDTLFFIFQEEKVARDVYITLGKMYTNESTFANIQISEQEHILSAQVLCERYGIDTSGVNLSQEDDFVGQLELHEMQELYNQCIELGQVSLLEALKVGRLIEVTDIDDLERAAEGMPSDVVRVYESLKDGSLNHLDAFEKAIARES
ncbi:MAG: DUF2202 domain-containing protein [Helicobacteraceae bacterium]|nr:DUF2202 domain-containing protein [Candidatus Sulfurimonas ponti]MBL6973262.1 DUF2202 domain-containing protein [Sulfurimonas sp.]